MRSRDGGRLALLLVLVASVAGACSKPKSFIVLTLRSADSTDIVGVTEVDVTVDQAPSLSKLLKYP
ncbi:MAG TPA: hypothetical protein VMT47_13310, partial [Polyangia bacterium]|nr:hypothetical protein [Polyangia bacterium]